MHGVDFSRKLPRAIVPEISGKKHGITRFQRLETLTGMKCEVSYGKVHPRFLVISESQELDPKKFQDDLSNPTLVTNDNAPV